MRNFALIFFFLIISLFSFSQENNKLIFKNDASLSQTFNILADSIAKNVPNKELSEIKTSFQQLITNNNINDLYRSNICDVLNYYSALSQDILVYSVYIQSFTAFLSSDFNQHDCDVWTKSILNNQIDKNILLKWKLIFSEQLLYSSTACQWKFQDGQSSIENSNSNTTIKFKNTTLLCPLYDSIIIRNCSGTLNIYNNNFHGSKGTITWEKTGLDANDVYVTMPEKFVITLDNSHIKIDSVSFYYKKYFKNTPLLGSFEDRCTQRKSADATYPKFHPYNDLITIKNIYTNVDFTGRFTLDGIKISGSGNNDEDANVVIYRDKRPFISLSAQHFAFTPKAFSSNKTKISILVQNDTISHPSCTVKYEINNHRLKFTRDADKSGSAPFISTYHKLNIYCDELNWNDTTEYLSFAPQTTFDKEGSAFFESVNFFSEERFRQFETPDGVNLLLTIYKYSKSNFDVFYLEDFAKYCKMSADQLKSSLLYIADYGIIKYDIKTDKISVNKKLFDYIASKSKKRDYDIISIYSYVKDHDNAIMDLKTMNLKIFGVDKLIMNEKNSVKIFPSNKIIDVSKNMDMHFSGYVQAGLIDIYTKDSYFKYNEFKIELPQVDSLSFYFYTDKFDLSGKQIVEKVYSPIENLKGYLEINKFYNKSGVLEDCKEFPKFWSTDSAFVYYHRQEICNNVYPKDKFFFLIDPFMVDSLATYIPKHISFSGELISDGIFDNFRENLIVMPGQSLGFVHKIPNEGYSIYNGKGKMYGTVSLSNECFQGNGKLDYLTAELNSDKFMLYPDSLNAIVDKVVIEQQQQPVEYPHIEGSQSYSHLDVANNNMAFNTISGDPYSLYNNLFTLKGELFYSADGINGKGLLSGGYGQLISDNFNFKTYNFTTDSTDFNYYLSDNKHTAVEASDYSLYMNVNNKEGYFNSSDSINSSITFKENGYYSDYNKFTWNLNNNTILLGDIDKTIEPANINNISILLDSINEGAHIQALSKKSDSLNFLSTSGKYDCNKSLLTFNGINYVHVSDAAIIPADRSLTATVGGALMPVKDGFIVINFNNKYHTLYRINATINSRNNFTGSGYYNYIDADNNSTTIFVEKVEGKDSLVKGIAVISELNPLPLNAVVDFQGTATLTNLTNEIDLEGFYHVKQTCFNNDTWITLAHNANPKNLMLPVNKSYLSSNSNEIFSGLNLSKPGAVLYPTFLSEKKKSSDWIMFNVEGLLTFDTNNYKIIDTTRTIEGLLDNQLTLHPENCTMEGAGKFDIIEMPGRLTVNTAGSMIDDLTKDSIILNTALFLNFHFNKQALDIMAKDLLMSNYDYQEPDNNLLNSALNFILPEDEFKKYHNDVSNFGSSNNIPEILKSCIVINNITLVWNDTTKVFYSVNPITVVSINGTPVNKTVKGVVEISKLGGTESISIMLIKRGDDNIENKYFFFYKTNNMFTYSTNDNFTNLIRNDSKNVRRLKREGKLPAYQYIIATSERLGEFCKSYGL